MKQQKYKIQGMHCVGCAMTVDGAVEEIAGVKKVHTHYAKQIAVVDYDERVVTDAMIVEAIQAAGYHAVAVDA